MRPIKSISGMLNAKIDVVGAKNQFFFQGSRVVKIGKIGRPNFVKKGGGGRGGGRGHPHNIHPRFNQSKF